STITDPKLRAATQDGLFNPETCVAHRARLAETDKQAILAELQQQGLLNKSDSDAFPGGAIAGIFPPLPEDGATCPHLPQSFAAAPGSGFNGHHSYPGGLPVHESFNLSSALSFSENYRLNVGMAGEDGLPRVAPLPPSGSRDAAEHSDLTINHDWIV